MKFKTIFLAILVINLIVGLASALTISSVESMPGEINSGEKVTLSLTIENNLDQDVENVVVTLDLKDVPFAPYHSSNEVSFEKIKEDKEKTAEFDLIADSDAESMAYKIPVKISYTIGGNESLSEGVISLIINARSEIQVNVEDSLLIKGRNADLKIKVINSGLGNAKLLSVEIKPVVGIKITDNEKKYIGDIDSDDFDTADFKVKVSEKAPSIINLPVEISYRDSRNNEITEIKNVVLNIYTEKQAISLGLIKKSSVLNIIIGIVIFLILYFIYRKIKKARKRKEKEG